MVTKEQMEFQGIQANQENQVCNQVYLEYLRMLLYFHIYFGFLLLGNIWKSVLRFYSVLIQEKCSL